MKTNNAILRAGIALMVLFMFSPVAYGLNAVASIKKVDGRVQIERGQAPKRLLIGRAGLILNDHDVVITGNQSKATILFRDGSEIRLFQKTRFEISQSKEDTSTGSRKFINKLMLRFGSFWGKFTKGNQTTRVHTPTATAGIKGTIVSFKEDNGKFSASLSSGLVEIKNDDAVIDLKSGQMINNVATTGSIQDKITDLPYQIRINPDRQKIDLPRTGEQTSVFFTLQLVNVKSNTNVNRSGRIYLSVDSNKIVFPHTIQLNDRGYTRVQAKIDPFLRKDYKKGQLEIIAIMDGEQFLDVGAGQTFITYDIPKGADKTIRIDGGTGQIN